MAMYDCIKKYDITFPVVWLFDISYFPSYASHDWWNTRCGLAADELSTASKYIHTEARMHYLGARALVRHALACVAKCQPEKLVFENDLTGKPIVVSPTSAANWHFNLSHSGKLIACAVWNRPIGVDVEPQLRNIDHLLLAKSLFSEDETKWITSKADRSKQRFMALWTLKEAFLKESGVGLSISLNQIRVRPGCSRRFVVDTRAVTAGQNRYCRLLRPLQGYWLAICTADLFPSPQLYWYMM